MISMSPWIFMLLLLTSDVWGGLSRFWNAILPSIFEFDGFVKLYITLVSTLMDSCLLSFRIDIASVVSADYFNF